ncbi:hypothetical protein TSOC_007795 [Tetrabaena socialis]|uniref:Uncharacterized protein n=1 Tax=Tetrabaena socialis TaxID=47790 RepID=A0A2J8A075_9CHLO|nr:hypothetical protein TSOC_007795 [Tetrabaena socialis]|eukprot:PNH05906.1 hypothetical protein TSOC_007795 [Tetrabaena socialis]
MVEVKVLQPDDEGKASTKHPHKSVARRPARRSAAADFILSPSFQCAAQLTVGMLVVCLFTFVKEMQFIQSCLAATLYIVCSVLVSQDNHVGTKLLGCAMVCGSMLWGATLAGCAQPPAPAPAPAPDAPPAPAPATLPGAEAAAAAAEEAEQEVQDAETAVELLLEADGEDMDDAAFLALMDRATQPMPPGPPPGAGPPKGGKGGAPGGGPPRVLPSPPIGALRPLLARARMCLGAASLEPPFLLAAPIAPPAWGRLIGCAEELLSRVAALECIISNPTQIAGDASLQCYFSVDMVPHFRRAYAHVATTCASLSEAIVAGGKGSGQTPRAVGVLCCTL